MPIVSAMGYTPPYLYGWFLAGRHSLLFVIDNNDFGMKVNFIL
jgi:hypothetical protein